MAFDGSEIAGLSLVDFGTPAVITTLGYPDITVSVVVTDKPIDIMGVQSDKPCIEADATYRDRVESKDSIITINAVEYRMIRPNTEMGITSAYLARI